jgi:hypothetical protein
VNGKQEKRRKGESEDEGYLSTDSEETKVGEDVICIGKCWTCKEDDEMRKEWGIEESTPTSDEHESNMDEESNEGYEMFEFGK